MDIEAVNKAAVAVMESFGAAYEGPCELQNVTDRDNGLFTVDFGDTRKSRLGGDLFSFDIDTREHSTPTAVQDFVTLKIRSHFSMNPI